MSRYWLVKAPDETMIREVLMEKFHRLQIVEIIPEKRDSNWMERAIAADLAAKATGGTP
ncbi:MAG: hypothetical protein ACREO3_01000 [Arenimonas sp.]